MCDIFPDVASVNALYVLTYNDVQKIIWLFVIFSILTTFLLSASASLINTNYKSLNLMDSIDWPIMFHF